MTTLRKIAILERALGEISWLNARGVCYAVTADSPTGRFITPFMSIRLAQLGLELPSSRFAYDNNDPHRRYVWSWPCNDEGDEQRREFLRKRINELKIELNGNDELGRDRYQVLRDTY